MRPLLIQCTSTHFELVSLLLPLPHGSMPYVRVGPVHTRNPVRWLFVRTISGNTLYIERFFRLAWQADTL